MPIGRGAVTPRGLCSDARLERRAEANTDTDGVRILVFGGEVIGITPVTGETEDAGALAERVGIGSGHTDTGHVVFMSEECLGGIRNFLL